MTQEPWLRSKRLLPPYAVLQFNRPDVVYDVPKMLFSSNGPLALKWNYIPKMISDLKIFKIL